MSIVYPTLQQIVDAHKDIIRKSGGLDGFKDMGQIESVLTHMANDMYYPEFCDKITYLFYGLVKNHACNDGNKRMTITASSIFLKNNLSVLPDDFDVDRGIRILEVLAVFVADNVFTKDSVKLIFQYILDCDTDSLLKLAEILKFFDDVYRKHIDLGTGIPESIKEAIHTIVTNYIEYPSFRAITITELESLRRKYIQ